MNSTPSVTTLIPTYNRALLLSRAIESARKQTHKNIEILISDNASNDNTGEMCREIAKLDERVKYIKNTLNLGSHENFRQGIKKIKTDYFSILSDDDYLDLSFYENGLRLFEKYPEAKIAVFTVHVIDKDDKYLYANENYVVNGDEYHSPINAITELMNSKINTTWTGWLFKKEIAEVFDLGPEIEFGPAADIYFIWHAVARYGCVVTNLKAANFTMHDDNFSLKQSFFDERLVYWWRKRIKTILSDNHISYEVKKKLECYYFKNSAGTLRSKLNYAKATYVLIKSRYKYSEKYILKFELVDMQLFLPKIIIISIQIMVIAINRLEFINSIYLTLKRSNKNQK